jgi:hypothetical protein
VPRQADLICTPQRRAAMMPKATQIGRLGTPQAADSAARGDLPAKAERWRTLRT